MARSWGQSAGGRTAFAGAAALTCAAAAWAGGGANGEWAASESTAVFSATVDMSGCGCARCLAQPAPFGTSETIPSDSTTACLGQASSNIITNVAL